MWVKICANTNLADAQLAAELGAHAVGFVFAPSKRQVSVEQVTAITPELPDSVEKIGVFHTQSAAEIVHAVRGCGLTAVQLHSSYNAEFVSALNAAFEGHVCLIQVVSVPVESTAEEQANELESAWCDPALAAVLLDAAKGGASGGLGVPFSWSAFAPRLESARARATRAAAVEETLVPKLILAGGLHAGNVLEAIATLKPDGVDVASGVEAEPGRKSPEKLRAFLQAARSSSAAIP